MPTPNKRLSLLSEAEQSALYELPDFDDNQCLKYLTLTEQEQALMLNSPQLSAKVYFALQIGYFKAVHMFFRFKWEDIDPQIITFVLQQYFNDQSLVLQPITKHEHYKQCQAIASLFGYKLWSKQFEPLVRKQTELIILRDVNPPFIVMELLDYFQEKKIIRPRYTTLQDIVGDTLNVYRKKLDKLINKTLKEDEKAILQKLLLKEDTLSGLAALKQDAKDFKARMMTAEREKLLTIGSNSISGSKVSLMPLSI